LFFLHGVFPPNFIQILYMVLKKDSGNLAVHLLKEVLLFSHCVIVAVAMQCKQTNCQTLLILDDFLQRLFSQRVANASSIGTRQQQFCNRTLILFIQF
jgi:hypothetical protein